VGGLPHTQRVFDPQLLQYQLKFLAFKNFADQRTLAFAAAERELT
jgi:hypothetical protein